VCLQFFCSCASIEDPVLPAGPARVLILGDSISIGYTGHVRKLLGEEAVVVRPTQDAGAKAENCAGTNYGKDHVERWLALDGGPFDVVHFNFGLHDLKRVNPETGSNSKDPADPNQAPLDTYGVQLRSISRRLLDSGATVIFATTTPVPDGALRPHRDPEDVERYNAVAVQVMAELGIQVNDLYAFILPSLGELQRPVNVHFTRAGSAALGGEVAATIRAADPRLSTSTK
jgi:acyl-CoA thioesterase-1